MKERHFRLIGKIMILIGTMLLFFPLLLVFLPSYIVHYWFSQTPGFLLYSEFLFIGINLILGGAFFQLIFEEKMPFLTKTGEPIHSAKLWTKGLESGLFLTQCERVVSINPESNATAHAGYRLVTAKRPTCSDCRISEGRVLLEGSGKRRSW